MFENKCLTALQHTKVRFFIPFTKYFNARRFVNFVSIDLILFSFESGARALYFMPNQFWKKAKNKRKK